MEQKPKKQIKPKLSKAKELERTKKQIVSNLNDYKLFQDIKNKKLFIMRKSVFYLLLLSCLVVGVFGSTIKWDVDIEQHIAKGFCMDKEGIYDMSSHDEYGGYTKYTQYTNPADIVFSGENTVLNCSNKENPIMPTPVAINSIETSKVDVR